jgi:hypothetical protein
MQSVRTLLVFPLVFLTMASSSVLADQQHLVPPSQLTATVADDVAKQDASRAAVHETLNRPEVQAVAAKLGLDLTRASAAVDTLRGADLARAAEAAQQVNEQLVGGASTVVISTTTIIIILLLIILLIIAIK